MKPFHQATVIAITCLLAACGGGHNDSGTLQETPVTLTTLTAAQIDASTSASGLQALSGKARCDVKVVAINYATRGPKDEHTNASGVLLLPTGSCTAAAPLVAYAKGTDFQKSHTLADPQDTETFLLAAMYAAQGYAVVATDYLGYAKSAFPYHPYLHGESEARTVLDSVRAARLAILTTGGSLSGQVMFTGYSQGGHASMAAHRAAESADNAGEFNVVAGAHLAGPYNLSGSFRSPVIIAGHQYFVPFIVTSWQKVYGNVYSDVNAAFKAPYAASIENLLPSPTLNAWTLLTSGALPGANRETPTQARDAMFQPSFLADVMVNDNNGLYVDARKNDMFGWSPRAATLLCGGAGDPVIPPAQHMVPMKADFDARGVTTVTTVDVDVQIQAAYGPGGAAPTDPMSAALATYYTNYHAIYEPPFCHARARAMFDKVI